MAQDTETEGLDVLETPKHTVTLAGREVQIEPLKLHQIPPFTRALKPAMPTLSVLLGTTGKINPLIVTDLLADHGEELIEAVRIATGLAPDDMQKVGLDELLEAIPTVLLANRDFFSRRLLPALQRAAAAAAEFGRGQTPSRP